MAQKVKNLTTVSETWVQSLGWENPLEKGMATHSSILGWRIPWTEETGELQSMRSQSWTRLSNSHTHTPPTSGSSFYFRFSSISRQWLHAFFPSQCDASVDSMPFTSLTF